MSSSTSFACLFVDFVFNSVNSCICTCTNRLIGIFSYFFVSITRYSMCCFRNFISNIIITKIILIIYLKFLRKKYIRFGSFFFNGFNESFTVFATSNISISKNKLLIKRKKEKTSNKYIRFSSFFFDGFNNTFSFIFSTVFI